MTIKGDFETFLRTHIGVYIYKIRTTTRTQTGACVCLHSRI